MDMTILDMPSMLVYLSALVVLTSPLPAPLPRECVPEICPVVDSGDWTLLQSRCCKSAHNVYHCHVGHDARVQAVCSKKHHEIPIPGRRGPNNPPDLNRFNMNAAHTLDNEASQYEDDPKHGDGHEAQAMANDSYLPTAESVANQQSDTEELTNQISSLDSSNNTNQSEATWIIVLIMVAMTAGTLVVLGLMVFFVIKYFAKRVNQSNSTVVGVTSNIQYEQIKTNNH